MGQGLGKNSPVVLSLGKDNYEALISRHGQWVRWRIASKCPCVSFPSMQPNIHCKNCGGLGFTYSFQNDQVVYQNIRVKDLSGIIEVSDDYIYSELIKVYDFNGKIYKAEKVGKYVKLLDDELPKKSSYITVVMKSDNIFTIEKAIMKKNFTGYYTIESLINVKPNIDGLYYNCPSDIIDIEKVVDSNNEVFEVEELRLNTVLLKKKIVEDTEIIPTEPLFAYNIKYLPPFTFAVLNQNLSKADEQAVVESQGDAIVIYPYGCNVANDDILTVLAGSFTQKDIIVRADFETDTIGAYFVEEVISCNGMIDGEIIEYNQGVDFILVENNKIKWISENAPEEGEPYSVIYKTYPTYKITKQIPTLRTSENQRFPKKAVVKLFSTYSENRKANVQKLRDKGI